jgi:superfamily II DNA helicase RecQ
MGEKGEHGERDRGSGKDRGRGGGSGGRDMSSAGTSAGNSGSGSEADLLLRCLQKYWGHSRFLEFQLEVCVHLLGGGDAFVLMATGQGKSVTFQLPAVYLRERGVRATVVVVSPLLSLIDDQVSG